jgi:hypothetical protein
MATKSVRRLIASAVAIPSTNQPIGFLGRRAAISTPRIPTMGAWRKYAHCVVSGESIACQSRASRTKLATRKPEGEQPNPPGEPNRLPLRALRHEGHDIDGPIGCRWCSHHGERVAALLGRRTTGLLGGH